MVGSILVFRGVSLTKSMIRKWALRVGKSEYDIRKAKGKNPKESMKLVPHSFCMQGNTSTSESYRVAL